MNRESQPKRWQVPDADGQDVLRVDALQMIALAAEYRRLQDGSHNERVGQLASMIAAKLGLPEDEISLIRDAAPLHDVGTIYIPEKILFKPAKLSPEEFEVVKSHVGLGVTMLQHRRSELLDMAKLIVETHHERFDGTGYPLGLKALRIPIAGQIAAVADVFDTLTHDQPYRTALDPRQAIEYIKAQAGSGFDPQVVRAFLRVIESYYWTKAPPSEASKDVILKGRLGVLNLLDLLTMLNQGKQSGHLSLKTPFETFGILLYGGSIVHAE